MKTVIFISNFIGNGGAARVINVLAEGLKKENRVIIASFPYDGPQYSKIEGVEYYDFSRVKSVIQRISCIRKLIKKHPQSIVIAFEYFIAVQTVLASFGCKCKTIVSERNDPHKLDKKIFKRIMRDFAYLCSDTLVCQTDDAKAYFPECIQKKAKVILNPIIDNLPEWDSENYSKTIVNFCRLEKQKNIPLLLEAFLKVHRNYSDYSLAIYGSGTEELHIRNLIEEMNMSDCVSLQPFSSNIHEVVVKSAMFVSSSDFEGLSNSMLESLAMGIPTVCTDCQIGGAKMVIEHKKNGLLVPVRDSDSLAEAMIWIIEHPVNCLQISDEAKKIRISLSKEKVVQEWLKLL